ncbi:hypothetical protein [Paraburkholderia youngii]|uniref:hypothetical protein n=1 Tax=Paraburkholderia youngii TaxID=2782701 RepID=UPI00158FF10B|nr:hypothetical protein [Paraburkholderia youngii]
MKVAEPVLPTNCGRSSDAQIAIQASASHSAPDRRGWDHLDNMSAIMGIFC